MTLINPNVDYRDSVSDMLGTFDTRREKPSRRGKDSPLVGQLGSGSDVRLAGGEESG